MYQINPSGSVFFDETPPDTDDTGAAGDAFRDDDPQPDGKIYDVDSPGFLRTDLETISSVDTIMRKRDNFRQFAEYQEPGQTVFQKCSEVPQEFDLRWFDRQSIILTDATTDTWVRENSVPTDNEVGEDTTSLKIDLSN